MNGLDNAMNQLIPEGSYKTVIQIHMKENLREVIVLRFHACQ